MTNWPTQVGFFTPIRFAGLASRYMFVLLSSLCYLRMERRDGVGSDLGDLSVCDT